MFTPPSSNLLLACRCSDPSFSPYIRLSSSALRTVPNGAIRFLVIRQPVSKACGASVPNQYVYLLHKATRVD